MYRNTLPKRTTIIVNNTYQGETLEAKIRRILNNNEPITDGAPIIYTERKDGVRPEYNIRTDRMEIAIDAMDFAAKANAAKRENSIALRAKQGMEKEAKSIIKQSESGETPANISN